MRAFFCVLTIVFCSPLFAQAPDGLYDMDVLNANPHLIQRFPGEVAPGNRTIIIVTESGARNVSGTGVPVPVQYQGDLLDFDSSSPVTDIEVVRQNSFENTSRRVERQKPSGPSFSDVADKVNRRDRLNLSTPTASRQLRDLQLYDF